MISFRNRKKWHLEKIQDQCQYLKKETERLSSYADEHIKWRPLWLKDIEERIETIKLLYVQLAVFDDLEATQRHEDPLYDVKCLYEEMAIRSQNMHAPDWDDLSDEQKEHYIKLEEKEQREKYKTNRI